MAKARGCNNKSSAYLDYHLCVSFHRKLRGRRHGADKESGPWAIRVLNLLLQEPACKHPIWYCDGDTRSTTRQPVWPVFVRPKWFQTWPGGVTSKPCGQTTRQRPLSREIGILESWQSQLCLSLSLSMALSLSFLSLSLSLSVSVLLYLPPSLSVSLSFSLSLPVSLFLSLSLSSPLSLFLSLPPLSSLSLSMYVCVSFSPPPPSLSTAVTWAAISTWIPGFTSPIQTYYIHFVKNHRCLGLYLLQNLSTLWSGGWGWKTRPRSTYGTMGTALSSLVMLCFHTYDDMIVASIHACVYNDFSPSRHENSTCVYNDFSPSRHENSTYVHSTRNQLADMMNFVLFQTPVHLASTCSRHSGMIFCMICLVLQFCLSLSVSVCSFVSLSPSLFLCLPLSLSPSLSLFPPPSLLPRGYTRHISCLKNIPRLRVVQTGSHVRLPETWKPKRQVETLENRRK